MMPNTNLDYGGNCAKAFRSYEQCLGGKIIMLPTNGEHPGSDAVPADWKKAILHARNQTGGTEPLGADIPPERLQPMRADQPPCQRHVDGDVTAHDADAGGGRRRRAENATSTMQSLATLDESLKNARGRASGATGSFRLHGR